MRFSHGEHREPAAPGSSAQLVVTLTDHRAVGVMNGALTAGVVISTDLSGSGTFYDLALLLKGAGGWKHIDTAFLGDRIKIHSVALRGNEMIIEMTTHGPQDALCCPTLRMTKRFAVESDRLVSVPPKTADDEGVGFVGPIWEWNQTVYNDGRRVGPPDSTHYTVQWLKDGTLAVKADCNSKGGSYSLQGDSLSVTITRSTLAACPEDSLENLFVHDLTGGLASWVSRPETHFLDLNYDAWTMTFSRQQKP